MVRWKQRWSALLEVNIFAPLFLVKEPFDIGFYEIEYREKLLNPCEITLIISITCLHNKLTSCRTAQMMIVCIEF